MKLIIAVIQPTKVKAVREALEGVEVERMTVCDSQGFARQRGRTETELGDPPMATLVRKVTLEVVVNDDFLDRTVEAITNVARTGSEDAIGDGRIFILPADEAIRLSDGAKGPGGV